MILLVVPIRFLHPVILGKIVTKVGSIMSQKCIDFFLAILPQNQNTKLSTSFTYCGLPLLQVLVLNTYIFLEVGKFDQIYENFFTCQTVRNEYRMNGPLHKLSSERLREFTVKLFRQKHLTSDCTVRSDVSARSESTTDNFQNITRK